MQGLWYGDRRDLVKWGALIHLAKTKGIRWIFQVAYLRNPKLQTEENDVELPKEVWNHFYDLRHIKRLSYETGVEIIVLDQDFVPDRRGDYINNIASRLNEIKSPKIVFLDPDTGIALKKAKPEHVSIKDIEKIWKLLTNGDIIALYQHSDRTKDWLSTRKELMSSACNDILINHILGKGIAPDMAILWCCKNPPTEPKNHIISPETANTSSRKSLPRFCACQCGKMTAGGVFYPGHDATLKSLFLKVSRGVKAKEDLSPIERKMYQIWEKNKSKRLIDIAKEVLG